MLNTKKIKKINTTPKVAQKSIIKSRYWGMKEIEKLSKVFSWN